MEYVNMRNSRRKGTVKFAGILLSVSFVISSTWLFKENDLHKQKYKQAQKQRLRYIHVSRQIPEAERYECLLDIQRLELLL